MKPDIFYASLTPEKVRNITEILFNLKYNRNIPISLGYRKKLRKYSVVFEQIFRLRKHHRKVIAILRNNPEILQITFKIGKKYFPEKCNV